LSTFIGDGHQFPRSKRARSTACVDPSCIRKAGLWL